MVTSLRSSMDAFKPGLGYVPDSFPPAVPEGAAVTVTEPPNETDEPLTVTDEFVNPALGIVATEPSTPPDVVVTYPAVVNGVVTVPVNVGEARGAFSARSDTRLVTWDSAIVNTDCGLFSHNVLPVLRTRMLLAATEVIDTSCSSSSS